MRPVQGDGVVVVVLIVVLNAAVGFLVDGRRDYRIEPGPYAAASG